MKKINRCFLVALVSFLESVSIIYAEADTPLLPERVLSVAFSSNDTTKDIFNKLKNKIVFIGDPGWQAYMQLDDKAQGDYIYLGNHLDPNDNNGSNQGKAGFTLHSYEKDDGRGGTERITNLVYSTPRTSPLTADNTLSFDNSLSFGDEPDLNFKILDKPPLDMLNDTVQIKSLIFENQYDPIKIFNQTPDGSKYLIVWSDRSCPSLADTSQWGNFEPRVGDKGTIVAVGVDLNCDVIYCISIATSVKTYYVNLAASELTIISTSKRH
jgi:hypothetical protein